MVKYREILRLCAMGISRRNIAASCGCSPSTVQEVLKNACEQGLSWPLPDEMTDAAIRSVIYPPRQRKEQNRAGIDHAYVNEQLQKRGVTMTLLWNEYCDKALETGKQPLMFTAFCSNHRKWANANRATMHIERRPADEIQVDWVGDTMQVRDPDTAELHKVYVFVACLPYSNYLFAEGFYSMDEESWITAHVHAFSFFGGTTPLLVPDNCKTGVIKNTVEELILNDQYRRMAEYYGVAVVPARPRKPRDKGAVEMGVGLIERQAIAPLRARVFFSLADLNEALQEKISELNDRAFQKREGSRASEFLDREKHLLAPLPAHPYEMVTRKRATVNFNYHISFDGCWYSVPFTHVKREVEIAATKSSVSILCDGERIAMHKRIRMRKGSYSTDRNHMPDSHRDFTEWNAGRFKKWASKIGPETRCVIDSILESHKVEQQGYRSCRALLGFEKKYGATLLEEACAKACALTPRPSYKTVKTIVSKLAAQVPVDPDKGAYLRGSAYYENYEQGE